MLLSDTALNAALDAPFDARLIVMPMLDRAAQVGPASIDVRLGTRFLVPRRTQDPIVDPATARAVRLKAAHDSITVAFGEPLWLHPGQLVLGSTLEYLRFPSTLGAYVVGRSSWGRGGLLVATAVMIQPGFRGALTLELVNHGEVPIALYAGCRIAQLAVHSLGGSVEDAYAGKYDGPTGPEASALDSEREEITRLRGVARRMAGGT